jgi:hypothetical protein
MQVRSHVLSQVALERVVRFTGDVLGAMKSHVLSYETHQLLIAAALAVGLYLLIKNM